jgi:cytochrome c peroxidase
MSLLQRTWSPRLAIGLAAAAVLLAPTLLTAGPNSLDRRLKDVLAEHGFTGRIEATLETRLGREINPQLADIGRLLWFDTIGGLADDNTCGGCHSPTAGFGDTQSIAIGVDNNGIVGPNRTGPRNQRRSPMVINSAFFPKLMWNGRFFAGSGDPFDNSLGLFFPAPEGETLSSLPHLLTAQAFIPPTERVEAAGFDFVGNNDDIRNEVLNRLNAIPAYRQKFGAIFPEVQSGGPITFEHFGHAIAEFELTLTFANAPIDKFARGNKNALSAPEKRGALLFFGKANCVSCHAVAGSANEMFSDFQNHCIGIPQIVPSETNMTYDGPGVNEDFGQEQISGNAADRYDFRTSPLRNVALQPTFGHNGAFTSLEAIIRHHLNPVQSAHSYTHPANLDADLREPMPPVAPVLAKLDPELATPIALTNKEFKELLAFVRDGLLDERAKPKQLRKLIPKSVPSGRPVLTFQ